MTVLTDLPSHDKDSKDQRPVNSALCNNAAVPEGKQTPAIPHTPASPAEYTNTAAWAENLQHAAGLVGWGGEVV